MIEDTVQDVSQEPTATCSTSGDARSRSIPFVLQVAGLTLLLAAVIVGFARWRTGSMQLVWPYLQGQRLLIESTPIELGEVSKGEVVERDVRVVNLSSGELSLVGSQASCGCIALDEFPLVIAPGEDRSLQLKIRMPSVAGSFEQTVKLFSDDKGFSTVVVAVSGDVR